MAKLSLTCAVALVAVVALTGCGSSDPSGPGDYQAGVYEGWPQIVKNEQVEGYLENAWQDPAYEYVIIAFDTRASDETAPPLASAQLARIQTTKLVGYRERGMRWIRLGGRPAVRWSFNVGDRSHIEFFFEECGISFLVRGTMGLPGFSALSESMREMAAATSTDCSA